MSKLTDAKLRSLSELGRHWDGAGLYLEATAAGGRYWRLKYRHEGKERRAALGVYPDVPLKLARERAEAARAVLTRGRDPVALWQAARELQAGADMAAIWRDVAELSDAGEDPTQAWAERKAQAERSKAATFEAVAREWLGHQSGRWCEHTSTIIRRSLEIDVFPKIGDRPMAEIRPREVLAAVRAIEARGAGETAGRVLQRVRAIYRFAVVHERIEANPMLDLKQAELLKPRAVRHRAAIDDKELPALLAALEAYSGEPTVKAALQLLMLTAVRPGELRGARWAEIDTAAALWRIPAERMKMKAPHLVPLSRQALEVLAAQRRLSGTDPAGLVFPSPWYPGRVLSENTLNSALARMGYKGEHSAHGFRALFSTVANEHGQDRDVIERTLAHVERDEVRAAYHRGAYLDERRKLLEWWGGYLDTRKAGGKVVKLQRRGRA